MIKERSINEASLFNRGDILDWIGLIERLKEHENQNEHYIWNMLDKKTREYINDCKSETTIDDELKDMIIFDLNKVVDEKNFYSSEELSDIKLSRECRILLKKGIDSLDRKKLRRLNRLILESIYPHEIARDKQNPSVTVDIVIFTIQKEKLCVLLIKRKYPPYKGKWAIPGGFVKYEETLDDAAMRELEEETGVKEVYIEQLYTFGEPRRDPRKRVITVAYFALISSENLVVRPDADVSDVRWFSVYNLPKLAFDHERIVKYALKRLRNKIMYTNVAFQLLSEEFTLTELQKAYEVILNKKLDKRNFRKKILSSNILEETGNKKLEGRHRPARLYRFFPKEHMKDHCLPEKEVGD